MSKKEEGTSFEWPVSEKKEFGSMGNRYPTTRVDSEGQLIYDSENNEA